jgi:hypothetical protein
MRRPAPVISAAVALPLETSPSSCTADPCRRYRSTRRPVAPLPGHRAARLVVPAILTLGLALAFSPEGRGDDPWGGAMAAQRVLLTMARAYGTCLSYRDTGLVRTTYLKPNGKRTVLKPFSTAFVRPDRFRFEYREPRAQGKQSRCIVWRQRKKVRTWEDARPGAQGPGSLATALAAAARGSGGSAHTVPAMLMRIEVGGGRPVELERMRRIEDRMLGKVDCYLVQGRYDDAPATFWVEKRTGLLWRIDSQHDFGTFRTQETTTYKPSFNAAIPPTLLAFNAPTRS